jgi:hypothetical protein
MTRWFMGLSATLLACAVPMRPDQGLAEPTSPETCESNPYGVCYPTNDIGTALRSGLRYGDRIPNLRFMGFRSHGTTVVETTAQPGTVSLADFYDPMGLMGNVLVVIISNHMWCGPSNEQADFFSGANFTGVNTGGASWAKDLAPLGVVVIEALDDGVTPGTSATLDELRAYVARHESDYTSVLDGDRKLAAFFVQTPWDPDVLVIDARSMELLSATVGFDTNAGQTLAELATTTRASPPRP